MSEACASNDGPVEILDSRSFWWTNPLLNRYAHDFTSVACLFAGNSAANGDWRATIDRVLASRVQSSSCAPVLLRQLNERRAPTAALNGAARLAQTGTVAIVTGQQAGLFGGPMYTLLKAVTAVHLARWVEATHGTPAVPVFWIESEDHDWAEIRSATFLDGQAMLTRARATDPPGAGIQPVATLALPEDDPAFETLTQHLPRTEFSEPVLAMLRRRSRPGAGIVRAFAGWMDELLGGEGLVVFEARPIRRRRPSSETSSPANSSAPAARRRSFASGRLTSARWDSSRRWSLPSMPLPSSASTSTAGTRWAARTEVSTPTLHSPRSWLKPRHTRRASAQTCFFWPIVQDRLFPTVCYVAGPSELVYQSQLGDVYRYFDVERPLIHPRLSATLLDAPAARFLSRYELSIADIQTDQESILRGLVAREFPPGLEDDLASAETAVAEVVAGLRPMVARIDQTLTGAVDTSVTHVHHVLASLRTKTFQAAKRKDETLRRQLDRAHTLIFPGRVPQERGLSALTFLNRHGMHVRDRLLGLSPIPAGRHHVLTF